MSEVRGPSSIVELSAERRRRLLLESPAENVIRGWFTGEAYRDVPVSAQRRRPHRKRSRERMSARRSYLPR